MATFDIFDLFRVSEFVNLTEATFRIEIQINMKNKFYKKRNFINKIEMYSSTSKIINEFFMGNYFQVPRSCMKSMKSIIVGMGRTGEGEMGM